MLIEKKPDGTKKIFPLSRESDGSWRYALQGFGNFSYVEKKISEQIEKAMNVHLNDLIVK